MNQNKTCKYINMAYWTSDHIDLRKVPNLTNIQQNRNTLLNLMSHINFTFNVHCKDMNCTVTLETQTGGKTCP
jgi:hypothetical protein